MHQHGLEIVVVKAIRWDQELQALEENLVGMVGAQEQIAGPQHLS